MHICLSSNTRLMPYLILLTQDIGIEKPFCSLPVLPLPLRRSLQRGLVQKTAHPTMMAAGEYEKGGGAAAG